MNPPKHVAIIMDGNGRWGIKKNKSRNFGHKRGLEVVENIISAAIEEKIKFLTLFVFSTEIIFFCSALFAIKFHIFFNKSYLVNSL